MSLRWNVWNVWIVAGILAIGIAEPSAQTPTLKRAMREKLGNAQGLLEAVITADYRAIDRYSVALGRISETEVASWQAVARPEYMQNAILFLESVQGLRQAAASRDVEAARQQYTNLISSCVHCHTYVRGDRAVSAEQPGQPLIAQR